MKSPQHTYDRTRPLSAHEDSPPPPHAVRIRAPIALIVALMFIAGLIGGGLAFAWQRVGDRDQALTDAIAQRDAARDEVTTLADRVDGLEGQLAAADTSTAELEGEVSAAQEELLVMLGPALPDGRHFGALFAVGATQKPPRLVIDIEQWFTDQAAREAALEDGSPPWDAGTGGFYIRNENPRWRIIEVDLTTRVALTTYPYGQIHDPRILSLERFAELFTFEDQTLQRYPYWITVEAGRVVAIEQQSMP